MIRILAVCTGNICRSPMAAGLLRVGTGVVGLPAKVASAGVVTSGRPADPYAVEAMDDRGIDISKHRSHFLNDVDIEAADLILAMAGEHVVEIVARVPAALPKTYTIKDFERRARNAGPRPSNLDPIAYARSLHDANRHGDMLRRTTDDDVDDPLGLGRKAFQRCADELEELVWTTVDLLAGYEPRAER